MVLSFSVSFVALLLAILYSLARYLHLRRAARRRGDYTRHRPILGLDLAARHAKPVKNLPPFAAPTRRIELASPDIRELQPPPASPVILSRRQFPAPGSPNLQLLSAKQRQSAQRRLSYEYPLPPSQPATPVLPFPATPPRFLPQADSALSCNFKFFGLVDNSKDAATDFTARLTAGPPRSPRSPFALPAQCAAESPRLSALNMAQERLQHLPSKLAPSPSEVASFPKSKDYAIIAFPALLASPILPDAILPVSDSSSSLRRSPSWRPIPVPPQHTVLSEEFQRVSSKTSPLLPSPIFVDPVPTLSASSSAVRRCPSFHHLPAALPSMPESGFDAFNPQKASARTMKRHSMVSEVSTSHLGSPVLQACVSDLRSRALLSTPPPPEEGSCTEENECDSLDVKPAESETEERFPLGDVHNTPTQTAKHSAIGIPVLEAHQMSSKHLAALISPGKASRRVDRGSGPVYGYHPEAPAVAIAKSIVRPAQDDFKNFSAALAAKFGQKGWAATELNELTPAMKKGKKKKKKKGVANAPSVPPSPNPNSASDQAYHAASTSTRPESVRDSLALENNFNERIVNTGCHPNCADIYCPGGCTEGPVVS
ncbi:hypothetical protein DFH06DRAFT_1349750 [Mycena polygramma]|nr:hypothetical protein DFH06DRAFT_1349750 [Mycena polygramma]